jgi:hypothetical protein
MELPERQELSAVVERYARFLARSGHEVGTRPLVLPNGDFFPDRFERDEPSVARLVGRMLEHAGMGDVPLKVSVVDEDGPEAPHDGGCSTGCQVPAAMAGSTPRLVDDGQGWTLNVPAYELAHPVVLTTLAARALGHVFLVETLPIGARIETPAAVTADVASVALGFGALLLEGAYIYSKSCGGPSVASVTQVPLAELAVLTALFAAMGNHPLRRALAELGTTQSAALGEAHEWAQSNPTLVERLRRDPGRVAAGDYSLEEAKPWLLRVLGKKSKRHEMPFEMPAVARPMKARAPDPKADELRALVEETLSELGADASAE